MSHYPTKAPFLWSGLLGSMLHKDGWKTEDPGNRGPYKPTNDDLTALSFSKISGTTQLNPNWIKQGAFHRQGTRPAGRYGAAAHLQGGLHQKSEPEGESTRAHSLSCRVTRPSFNSTAPEED